MSETTDKPSNPWQLDGGPDDCMTPRDLFRAMCVARAFGEHAFADRLRDTLYQAFTAAGAPIPPGAEAIYPAVH